MAEEKGKEGTIQATVVQQEGAGLVSYKANESR